MNRLKRVTIPRGESSKSNGPAGASTPSRRPTIRDVADRAGVSFKTVSRVVNGEGGVSPGMVARVEQAVHDLDYRLDHRARQLRRCEATASTIGFVLVDVANQFFGTLLRGIEEVATTRQCLVLAGSTNRSPERERQLIEAFVERRVDGLIVVYSGSDATALASEIDRGTPIVFLDLEPQAIEADLVRSDHYAGARLATEHLIKNRHNDVAYFGDDVSVFSATQRLRGFLDAMAAAGLAVPDQRIVTGAHTAEDWRAIALDFFGRELPPTAVFTSQNMVTAGTVGALHHLGMQRTIAQVGFDDIDLASVVEPPITVVRQDPLDLGRRAAGRLFARIDGDASEPTKQIHSLPLIVRGSGELPPYR